MTGDYWEMEAEPGGKEQFVVTASLVCRPAPLPICTHAPCHPEPLCKGKGGEEAVKDLHPNYFGDFRLRISK
jgi:hypothetical protein